MPVSIVSPLTVSAKSIPQFDVFAKIGIPNKDVDQRHAARVPA